MFKEAIRTALNNPASNAYFNKIKTGGNEPDGTLLSTLRALVFPRMDEYDVLYADYSQESYTAARASRLGPDAPSQVCSDSPSNDTLCIINFTSGYPDDNVAWMQAMETYFPTKYPDFSRLEKITVFFKKQFDVLCYVCADKRTTYVFANNMNERQYHYLQCSIPAMLPWYFAENTVNEQELELINSLREKTPDHYLACIARYVDSVDIRSAFIRSKLSEFETVFEQREKKRVEDDISNIMYNINQTKETLGNYYNSLRQKKAYLFGLEQAIMNGTGESEIMDYFLANKKLSLIGVDGTHLRFLVEDRLMFWNEEAAETLINNDRSYLYKPEGYGFKVSDYIPLDDMKRLLQAILIDKKLYLRFCAAIDLPLDGTVKAAGRYNNFYRYNLADSTATPNPHLYWHNCFGGNESAINDLIMEKDYIVAVEQCAASVKNINIEESLTVIPLIKTLCTGDLNNRCIELPDGSVVKPLEAIAYLKKEEQQNVETDQSHAE